MQLSMFLLAALNALTAVSWAAPTSNGLGLPPGVPTIPHNDSAKLMARDLEERGGPVRIQVVCPVAGCCTPFAGQFLEAFTQGGQIFVGTAFPSLTQNIKGNFVPAAANFETVSPFLSGQFYISTFLESVFIDRPLGGPFDFYSDPTGANIPPFAPALGVDSTDLLGIQGPPSTLTGGTLDVNGWSACQFQTLPATLHFNVAGCCPINLQLVP